MDEITGSQRDTPQLYAELFRVASYDFEPLAAAHFLAAAVVAGLAIFVLHRERSNRVSQMFAGFALLFMLWAAGRGLMRLLDDPELVVFLARRVYALIMIAVAFLYHFALIMLRTNAQRRNWIRAMWAVGILFAFASFSSTTVIGGAREYLWGFEPQYGWLGFVSAMWVVGLMAATAWDAAHAWRSTRPDSDEGRRVRWFVAALGILYLAVVEFLPLLGVAFYPVAFLPITVFTMITAVITRRYGLVEVTPQMAAQEIAGLVRGALLILDSDGVVQFANAEAMGRFGDRGKLVGRPGRALLGEHLDPPFLRHLARLEGREAEQELVHRPRGGGSARDYALSVVAVEDEQQRSVAYVCLFRDVTEQKQLQQKRMSEGLRDPLTGLPGRVMFLELLESAVRRASQDRDYQFAVCFIGIDRFSVVNEDLGYSVGDQVLAESARRLRAVARGQDVVARLGGDEFGILLDAAEPESLRPTTRRLKDALSLPMQLSDHDLHLSSSFGIASSALAYTSGAEILRDASVAMYRVKQAGGGNVHVVAQAERGAKRTRLEAELHRAVELDEFRVFYQPVVDLGERRIAGFEALVRWQHPERGLVLPGDFIELAEQIGLARQIDAFVMEQACDDLKHLQTAARDRQLYMSFNMAEGAMREPDLVTRLQAAFERNGLEPASLRMELLERVAMTRPLRQTFTRLRRLGIGLYIDDFGTGYSSLSRLHEIPLTGVKIDREFVQAMSLGRGGEKVIAGIMALAQSLGFTVVAEGAGQAREARRLRDLGCRLVQGFFFSPAIPLAQCLDLVRDGKAAFADKHTLLDAEWLTRLPDVGTANDQRDAGGEGSIGGRISRWFGRT